jgi:hypothetical protein
MNSRLEVYPERVESLWCLNGRYSISTDHGAVLRSHIYMLMQGGGGENVYVIKYLSNKQSPKPRLIKKSVMLDVKCFGM